MAAAVRVRTMRFDERPSVGDADDAPLAPLAAPTRKQFGLHDRMTNPIGRGGGGSDGGGDNDGDDASELWFKDNRLGHRHQAAYLRRLERLRHDLHDAEREHLRDSLDRLLGLSRGGAAGKQPEVPAPPPAATVGWALADRRAPWLARSPEERALLESAIDGARRAHNRPRRSAEPPAPAVRRLLAAADAPASVGAARRSAASGHESGLATTATVSSCGYSRGGSGGAGALTSQSLALGRRDDPAAVGTSFAGTRASPPCAPTIPTLNRMPSKFSVAASDSRGGSQKKDASARCSRTAPSAAAAPAGGRGRLAKGGSLARAVTAMRASAATAGSGGGGEQLLDPSALMVPGKRLAVAPAAYDYDAEAAAAAADSTPLTPTGDDGDSGEVLPEHAAAAAALIEPGLRVVLPDPGARALSRSTDFKCDSAMQQRTRSVTFVSTYA